MLWLMLIKVVSIMDPWENDIALITTCHVSSYEKHCKNLVSLALLIKKPKKGNKNNKSGDTKNYNFFHNYWGVMSWYIQ